MLSDVISRNNVYSDVEDIVFRYKGETRIGREFDYNCQLSDIDHLLGIQGKLSTDLVVFPDKKHQVTENRICLSVSADSSNQVQDSRIPQTSAWFEVRDPAFSFELTA